MGTPGLLILNLAGSQQESPFRFIPNSLGQGNTLKAFSIGGSLPSGSFGSSGSEFHPAVKTLSRRSENEQPGLETNGHVLLGALDPPKKNTKKHM